MHAEGLHQVVIHFKHSSPGNAIDGKMEDTRVNTFPGGAFSRISGVSGPIICQKLDNYSHLPEATGALALTCRRVLTLN